MKIVINARYGGFGLSDEGSREWLLRSETVLDIDNYWSSREIPRDDPFLVEMVEYGEGGHRTWGTTDLRIVVIPDDVQWYISEYDGLEHVAEGRTWREYVD